MTPSTDHPSSPTPPDLEAIKTRIGIDGISLRISENTHFLWATITKDGRSFSHRMIMEPTKYDIDVLKDAVEQWKRDEADV